MTVNLGLGTLLYTALTAMISVAIITIFKPLVLFLVDAILDHIIQHYIMNEETVNDIEALEHKTTKLKNLPSMTLTKNIFRDNKTTYYIGDTHVNEKQYNQYIENVSSDRREFLNTKYRLTRKSDRLNWLIRRFDLSQENPIETELKITETETIPHITQKVQLFTKEQEPTQAS